MPRFDFCLLNLGSDEKIATVFRDDKVVVFMSNDPATDVGHVLVVPIKHHSLITEMPAVDFLYLTSIVHRVASAEKKAYNTDSVKIEIFDGERSGGTVDHVHIHVWPCFEGNGYQPEPAPVHWKTFSQRHGVKKTFEELKKDADKIRSFM